LIILGIHSSGAQLAVAVTRGAIPLAETVLPPARTHLERLAPLIQETLTVLGLEATDLDGFGVALGPGSFSGIRVGLATAKGMAAALGKPIVGISSLELIAWRALTEGETGVSLLDARRGEVYAAAYRREGSVMKNLREATLIPVSKIDEFARDLGGKSLICGAGPWFPDESHTDASVFRRIVGPSAAWAARLAAEKLEAGYKADPHALIPLYVRKSDAEEKTRPPAASRMVIDQARREGAAR
jgi:tRNA threonylcarbamoyladenosine biosynthesis protein TsaB